MVKYRGSVYTAGMGIKKNLKWALVLSGGGAKGLVHVGFLKGLSRLGYPEPSLVAGTSMGAVVGGVYASGMPVEEIVRFAEDEFDITQYLDSFVFKLGGPVGKFLQVGQLLGNLMAKPGVDSGKALLALLRRLTRDRTFEEARIPFRCNAVDLTNGKEVIFESGNMAEAIRASMGFPVFFEPVLTGGMCLVDGGVADNLPVHIAGKMGFKRILAVDVGEFKNKKVADLVSAPKILYRCLEIVLHRLHRQEQKHNADLVIAASNKVSFLSFDRKRELIDLGEQAVRDNEKALAAFFGGGPRAYLVRKRLKKRSTAHYRNGEP
ncbi:MAG: patatin-like phospholipase family protein [Spirochaetaceae bacterium]|jgi:NTE family protein|nr:patatin-like phospholipase family protein [Spirochaetaceae bacterium]